MKVKYRRAQKILQKALASVKILFKGDGLSARN